MSAYYNESDPKACAWLAELMRRGHIPPGYIDDRSIEQVSPDDVEPYTQCHFFAGIGGWALALRLADWPDDRRVWTGSCPCQPFSAAGKRQGVNDSRHLWPVWFELIRARRPQLVFGEQVSSKDALNWIDLVQADLEGEDYTLGKLDTCAAGVGAPHRRQRMYFVAWLGSDAGGVADSTVERYVRRRSGQASGRPGESERLCDALSLGDPMCSERRPGDRQSSGHGQAPGRDESSIRLGESDATRGFWRQSDWVLTRSQRVGDRPSVRPAEPGTFPLAPGLPARVGRLRGYGNAINAPLAAKFIEVAVEEFGLG